MSEQEEVTGYTLIPGDDGMAVAVILADGTRIEGEELEAFLESVVEPQVDKMRKDLKRVLSQNQIKANTLVGLMGPQASELTAIMIRMQCLRNYILPEKGSIARLQYDLEEETVLGAKMEEAIREMTHTTGQAVDLRTGRRFRS